MQRLERVRADREDVEAYVIFLTNDATYWNQPTGSNTVGAAFGLQEGRPLPDSAGRRTRVRGR